MDNRKQAYFELKEYHKKLHEQHLSMFFIVAQSFDKAILALSTISLGFTFAFLEVKKVSIHCECLLEIAWFFFIVTILATLITFIFVQQHALHRINYFSCKILDVENGVSLAHWTDGFIGLLPYISTISFVAGLTFFTIFVGLNV